MDILYIIEDILLVSISILTKESILELISSVKYFLTMLSFKNSLESYMKKEDMSIKPRILIENEKNRLFYNYKGLDYVISLGKAKKIRYSKEFNIDNKIKSFSELPSLHNTSKENHIKDEIIIHETENNYYLQDFSLGNEEIYVRPSINIRLYNLRTDYLLNKSKTYTRFDKLLYSKSSIIKEEDDLILFGIVLPNMNIYNEKEINKILDSCEYERYPSDNINNIFPYGNNRNEYSAKHDNTYLNIKPILIINTSSSSTLPISSIEKTDLIHTSKEIIEKEYYFSYIRLINNLLSTLIFLSIFSYFGFTIFKKLKSLFSKVKQRKIRICIMCRRRDTNTICGSCHNITSYCYDCLCSYNSSSSMRNVVLCENSTCQKELISINKYCFYKIND